MMARSRHGVAVKRCSGLVLAALAALMLSVCAPRAAAVRLPDASNAADHSCVQRKCGAHAVCVKERGNARCVCNRGFSMTPAGCVGADACALKACGSNGKCTKDSAGVASCVCDTGFALQADGVTCTDTCALKACGVNGQCSKDAITGAASCVCDTGFALQADDRTCTDTCTLKGCRGNGTCTKKSTTGVASCVCDTGFELEADGRTCTDTCALKACGTNGTCVKNSTTGAASCVCDTGYVLHADGKTCTDTCVIKGCNTYTTDCVKDAAGAASCVCKPGYQNISGTCMGMFVHCPDFVLLQPDAGGLPRVGSALQEPAALCCHTAKRRTALHPTTPYSTLCIMSHFICSALLSLTTTGPASCGVCPAGASFTVLPYTKAPYSTLMHHTAPDCIISYSASYALLSSPPQGLSRVGSALQEPAALCCRTPKPHTAVVPFSVHAPSAVCLAHSVCSSPLSLTTTGPACGAIHQSCSLHACTMSYSVCSSPLSLTTTTGPSSCGVCPAGATCTPVPYTKAAYCACPPGYGMTAAGCVLGMSILGATMRHPHCLLDQLLLLHALKLQHIALRAGHSFTLDTLHVAPPCVLFFILPGATPTVSSTSFSFYTLPSFGITPAAYTMRLTYNGCTNLTASSAPDIKSYCDVEHAPSPFFGITPAAYTMRLTYNGCTNLTASSAADIKSYSDVERAPGGAGDCTEVRQYYQPGCVGSYSLFPVTQGTGVSTGTTSNYPAYPYRSFACSITEKCSPNTCGGNGTCVQDSAGVAFCACNAGFLLQPDARTCAEACGSKICDPTTDCVIDAPGGASCVCKAGYQSISGACVGPATCGSCPAGATCTVAFSVVPYCICPPGYGMTSTGCISGATPTVSSTSITFYDQPSYTITTSTFTMRLQLNACTTLPAVLASQVWSTWRLDGAPGGAGECVSLNQYEQEGCVGTYTSSPTASDGTSMAGLGFTKYLGYPYRSFSCNGIGGCCSGGAFCCG
ncbi:unnamed protein product, partial [Closterium sp. Yama58-4]